MNAPTIEKQDLDMNWPIEELEDTADFCRVLNEIVSEDSELLTASGSDVGTAGR